jgi:hypothetical protein
VENQAPPSPLGVPGLAPAHDLFVFMQEASEKMSAEYQRVHATAASDPGTAGDEGEENWASLLRDWLPTGFEVKTKGRLLSTDGRRSPQVDVIVLRPSYPRKLIDENKKVYLAEGVAAAFECKLTLRSGDFGQGGGDSRRASDLSSTARWQPISRTLKSLDPWPSCALA